MGTQTDFETPGTSPSHSDEHKRIVEEDEPPFVKPIVKEPEEIDYTKMDLGPYSNPNKSEEFDGTTVNDSVNDSPREHEANDAVPISIDSSFVTDDEDDLDEEEPVIFEAAAAQATIMTPKAIKAHGGLVNIPKRPPPPPLPPRNVARSSRNLMVDQASGRSPMKSEFEEVKLHGGESPVREKVWEKKEGEVVESEKIYMQDLEKMDTETVAASNETVEEKVQRALEAQPTDGLAPAVEMKVEDVLPELKKENVVPEVLHHEEVPEVKRESRVPGGFDEY
jgi:hypothetical protein